MHDNSAQESFSADEEDEENRPEEDNTITQPVENPARENPTPLHVLSRRPPAPWGRARTVNVGLVRNINVDFIGDLQEVRWGHEVDRCDESTTPTHFMHNNFTYTSCRTCGGDTWRTPMHVARQNSGRCTRAYLTSR